MNCPLCGCSGIIVLRTFQVDDLREMWVNTFSFDPFGGFNHKSISKKQCVDCDLIYFDPPLYGDSEFYEKLSKFSWYYENDKWEFDVAAQLVTETRPNSFLEIGCGAGCFLKKISSAIEHVEGLDINEDAIRKCANKGLSATTMSIKSLDKSYDMIALFEVLEHMDNLSKTVHDIVKHLSPGGKLILAVPNPDGYLKDIDINLLDMPPHHNSSWPKKTFDYLATLHGLEMVGYYQEPLRYVHYLGYLGNIIADHRKMMAHGMKKKLFSFAQSAFINIFAPFTYIQHRENIIGQTHLVVLKKK